MTAASALVRPTAIASWLCLALSTMLSLTGCTDSVDPVCGNGVIEDGETCDDAGTAASDGCSASCQIEDGFTCSGAPSTCEPAACEPACEGKACGPDGCGGVCGTCEGSAVCQAGECVQCEPQCNDLECGNDGCGGSCGECGTGEVCQSGSCVSDGTSACAPNPCENGGICSENAAGVPECACPDDFVGDYCETPVALQNCNVDLDRVGDGICENSLNILACLYDGGDCCESTCPQETCEGATDSTCFDPSACENIPTCDLKCEDVTCATPPASYCDDGLLVKFGSEGRCSDGACSYTPTLEACAEGTSCVQGACRADDDACVGLSCDVTASAFCLDEATLSYPDTNATCTDGVCGEVMMSKRCPSGVCLEGACTANESCSADVTTLGDGVCQSANNSAACNYDNGDCCASTCEGACEGLDAASCQDPHSDENDGCATRSCETPESTCNDSQDAILSYESGQCIQGSCVFVEVSSACPEAWLCNNATCVDVSDPCALVTCDEPPASECADDDTVRTYAAAGTCSEGNCSYESTETDCAENEICTDGVCYAIADAFEPDSADSPQVLTASQTVDRSIDPSSDEDFFSFTIYVDASVVLETSGVSGDTKLYLYNDVGTQIDYNDDGGASLFSRIDTTIEAGTYLAKVTNYTTTSPIISNYALEFTVNPEDAFDGCAYLDCSEAPAPTCNAAGDIVTYSPPGECVDNACVFTETTSSCEDGFICSGGLCLDASDPCAGIVCNTPPDSACTSPTRGTVYGDTGTCVEGECIYEATVNQCGENEGCNEGICEECTVSYLNWLGDGYCDSSAYNSAACGWDGGDCCPSTCTGSCTSVTEADCLDPFASENAPDPSDLYPDCPGTLSWIGDGNCDAATNVASCGWDGGDCCASTNTACTNSTSYPCNCLDPNAEDATDTSDPTDPEDPTAPITFTLDPDSYYLDATWWVESSDATNRVAGPFGFNDDSAIEKTISLKAGEFCVVIKDAYGDGGTTGNVANGDTTLVAWAAEDYTETGRYCFTVNIP